MTLTTSFLPPYRIRTLTIGVASSLVLAFALASRNVAVAGTPEGAAEPKPAATYSAPVEEPTARRAPEPQSLIVLVDHLQRLSFSQPVKTVLVGNPAIADVTMISNSEAVVAAKTVGATNLFFLDAEGGSLGDFDVVVREGEERRVLLRRGPSQAQLFQCAPRCERTLSQLDSANSHKALSGIISDEGKIGEEAVAAGEASAR